MIINQNANYVYMNRLAPHVDLDILRKMVVDGKLVGLRFETDSRSHKVFFKVSDLEKLAINEEINMALKKSQCLKLGKILVEKYGEPTKYSPTGHINGIYYDENGNGFIGTDKCVAEIINELGYRKLDDCEIHQFTASLDNQYGIKSSFLGYGERPYYSLEQAKDIRKILSEKLKPEQYKSLKAEKRNQKYVKSRTKSSRIHA